ncbi:MAG TPA: SUMF1/EgtB/PvdO family nonheme iron enzyme [Pseudobdellovibrionaceae bacterium]|nr:SUMF1/EgtB/PvdO family nonheme iron enzyme [Pseudobdellovibrionaceae bacterium]
MRRRRFLHSLSLFGVLFFAITPSHAENAKSAARVGIKSGIYSPLFREPDEVDRKIQSFALDQRAVTRRQFAEFLKQKPEYSPGRIASRLADKNYLEGWKDNSPPQGTEDLPVSNVSWFAARAYCKQQGGRLPTVDEWEFAADAQNPANLKKILDWYAKPADELPQSSDLKPDGRGLIGMHGVIWEWTEDFSSVLIQGDSRSSNDTSNNFCGAGALNAKRPNEYATFMRFAFRSSLRAASSARSLGFRCAYDSPTSQEKPK